MKPGTPVIEVRWQIAPTPMALAELRSRTAGERVEVTVYSDGFERGLFANIAAVKPKAAFAIRRAPGAAAPMPSRIPGLEKLVVAEVTTTGDTQPPVGLRLFAAAPAGPQSAIIRVEGVDPGMNYSWRIPSVDGGRTVVTCQATVCPIDRPRTPAAPRGAAGKKQ